MAHTTEEKKQNPQNEPSHSYVKHENQGNAFEYQKDKPITGEQHGSGDSGPDRAQNQPRPQEQKSSPSGGAKR